MAEPRIIIIGAGPAGVRAAQAVVKAGIRPLVIDEGQRSGGQIYRRQPVNFTRDYETLYGSEAMRAKSIHKTFDDLLPYIDYESETLVWNISEGNIWVTKNKEARAIPYDGLIVCSGATDRLFPIKGWNHAGCYSLGGAQIALKAQACAIGSNVVFIGSGPLLYLVSAQYIKAGAKVAAVLDTSKFINRIKALPDLMVQPDLLFNGVKYTVLLKQYGVKLYDGIVPKEINGDSENGVSGISFYDKKGNETEIKCDAVAMGWHLKPETQIADLARCEFAFDSLTRQWLPITNNYGRSSVNNIYLAGDGEKILGARSAEITGELAALSLVKDFGIGSNDERISQLIYQKQKYVRFAKGLAKSFPWPYELIANLSDDTIICRCETVSVGNLRDSISSKGAVEANRAKAYSRVGMGRCQGRFCGHAAAEIIAAARGQEVKSAGRLRTQAPVKPISIATIRTDI